MDELSRLMQMIDAAGALATRNGRDTTASILSIASLDVSKAIEALTGRPTCGGQLRLPAPDRSTVVADHVE